VQDSVGEQAARVIAVGGAATGAGAHAYLPVLIQFISPIADCLHQWPRKQKNSTVILTVILIYHHPGNGRVKLPRGFPGRGTAIMLLQA
jgi:hypothetical protein